MSTFLDLGVHKDFIKGLKELGIQNPTEIQEKTIPFLLENRSDFIGLAQTGTGKTAAFGLPILQQIDPKKDEVQALILSPTRELVQQIKKQLFKFTKYVDGKIFIEGVYGGEKIERQIKNLKRTTHIIVATPGRLIDLIERGEVDLKNIKTLVLDEADEMLSMGFKLDINRILKYTSGERNTWLFSATMPEEIKRIVKTYMNINAKRVEINPESLVNSNISHLYVKTTLKEKMDAIISFLEKRSTERGIIFCRTKAGARKLTAELQEEGFSVDVLEGDMKQIERDKVMRAFKNQNLQYLVSTDVAARGIDVRDLNFVVHHQLPEQLEYFTHRSGRTARAGKKGVSIAFILPNELEKIHQLQKQLHIKFVETTLK
ncbi:ATP-dependent RNA helicase DeaD [Tenacibaculum adriaticum]|uniref:RNA helicase n=1 Tax=Tenacibaculum adriaticum TaxID=413713 RepID=A0A5S5DSQ5_9FLAO|nr:DEAD/DEAH box helicase [Tenacibaculum adriaticum]TYP98921.1 ATP-dependent RNA helicase DeaD [Tenacibaculum adriaticum]